MSFAFGQPKSTTPNIAFCLLKLKKNPSAKISRHNGWSIISLTEDGNRVIWFFSPKEHAAHPAVIKKTISKKGSGIETVITTGCEAKKHKCDDLSKQFKSINEKYK